MAEHEPGFVVNGKTLGFIISLMTFAGLVFAGFSSINSYSYRIDRIEQDNKVLASDISKISDRLSDLNNQLTSLTITLNKVEERLNARLEKKN